MLRFIPVNVCVCQRLLQHWTYGGLRFWSAEHVSKKSTIKNTQQAAQEKDKGDKRRAKRQRSRDTQIIRGGHGGRDKQTHRQAAGRTARQDECVPTLLHVLRELWISSSRCCTFSMLHWQWLDIRCEPAEQPHKDSPKATSGFGERVAAQTSQLQCGGGLFDSEHV